MIVYPRMKVFLDADISLEARNWRNDKRVWKWCRQHTLLTHGEHIAWMQSLQTSPHRMYSVHDLISKKPIGVCGLTDIDHLNQKAEFSLYIEPEQHQKGYGKDALLTLLRHGFDDHNMNCIWGETYDGNPAAKLFTKLGMVKEGTHRERYFRDGRFIDTHIFAITRSDFRRVVAGFFPDRAPAVDSTPDVAVVVDKYSGITRKDVTEGLIEWAGKKVSERGLYHYVAAPQDPESYSSFGESGSGVGSTPENREG